MRVPANTIEVKYTEGKEFVFSFNYKFYQGYYYAFNDKFFAGKEFNVNAPELIRASSRDVNTALTRPATYIYGTLSNIKPNNKSPKSIIPRANLEPAIRYFIKKLNNYPILIKEVDKKTFDEFSLNPTYQTISLEFPEGGYFSNQESLDEADKKMPGIKAFVMSELAPD